MSAEAFLLVLAAAALHAGWNFLVKASDDRLATTWSVAFGAALVNVPVLAVLGLPETGVLGWLSLSAVLHIGYGYALAAAYNRVDLSAAYPIARGTAPLLVTGASAVFLGDTVSPVGLLGIVLVAGSLCLIGLRHVPSGASWAVLTGVFIAAYTVADGAGVRAGDEAVRYIGSLFVLHAALFTVVLAAHRGSTASLTAVLRGNPGRVLIGGAGSGGAYLLVMMAARTAPLGLVSGLREISAGLGVIAAAVVLKERVSMAHGLAVAAATAGSIAIAVA